MLLRALLETFLAASASSYPRSRKRNCRSSWELVDPDFLTVNCQKVATF